MSTRGPTRLLKGRLGSISEFPGSCRGKGNQVDYLILLVHEKRSKQAVVEVKFLWAFFPLGFHGVGQEGYGATISTSSSRGKLRVYLTHTKRNNSKTKPTDSISAGNPLLISPESGRARFGTCVMGCQLLFCFSPPFTYQFPTPLSVSI